MLIILPSAKKLSSFSLIDSCKLQFFSAPLHYLLAQHCLHQPVSCFTKFFFWQRAPQLLSGKICPCLHSHTAKLINIYSLCTPTLMLKFCSKRCALCVGDYGNLPTASSLCVPLAFCQTLRIINNRTCPTKRK